MRRKRQCEIDEKTKIKSESVINICRWLLLAWFLHYLPFFAMNRVLYYHHYFPAFMISAMLSGILLEHIVDLGSSTFFTKEMQTNIYNAVIGAVLLLTVCSFYAFRGLTYGMSGPLAGQPNATAAVYKWLDSWNHYDNDNIFSL